MEPAQGTRWDAAVAALVTITVNAGLFWLLSRMMGSDLPPTVDSTMDVVWIVRRPAPTTEAPAQARPARMPHPRRNVTASAQSTPQPLRRTADDPQAGWPEGRPMSAIYLMQARQAELPVEPVPRDPFAERHVRLPGEGSERFRMRRQTSVATVVNRIGRMFGGGDPDAPCRENRRNIRELAPDGDSAVLQQQLDVERRHCRP